MRNKAYPGDNAPQHRNVVAKIWPIDVPMLGAHCRRGRLCFLIGGLALLTGSMIRQSATELAITNRRLIANMVLSRVRPLKSWSIA